MTITDQQFEALALASELGFVTVRGPNYAPSYGISAQRWRGLIRRRLLTTHNDGKSRSFIHEPVQPGTVGYITVFGYLTLIREMVTRRDGQAADPPPTVSADLPVETADTSGILGADTAQATDGRAADPRADDTGGGGGLLDDG